MSSAERPSQLVVTLRAHWVNRWLLSWAARPYVSVDGVEHECQWARPRRVQVPAGRHLVAVYFRYRHTAPALGTGRLSVHTPPGLTVWVAARTSWVNHLPFAPAVEPAPGDGDHA